MAEARTSCQTPGRLAATPSRSGTAGIAPRPSCRGTPPLRLYHEPALLGTGGALVNAADFWGAEPLLVWNGDILAELALERLAAAHAASGALATLVLQARESDSHLLADAAGQVCGIDSARRGVRRVLRAPHGELRALAFHGVSLLSPGLRAHLPAGAFDLVDALLEAIAAGAEVRAFDARAGLFGTTGSPAQLARLEADLHARPDVLARWSPS